MVDPGPTDMTPAEARDALAAELALGLLEGADRAEALRLRLADPEFAALVAKWEQRFAALHAETDPVDPPAELWDAIAARLPGAPADDARTVVDLESRVRRWRFAAIGSGAVAAALALVLLTQQPPPPTPALAPQLAVARIEGEGPGPLVQARYDRTSGIMQLRVEGIAAGQLVPELWVIPADGVPVSMGQFDAAGTAQITTAAQVRALLTDGVTLAITMEPASSIPSPAPTSAPIAAGKVIIL